MTNPASPDSLRIGGLQPFTSIDYPGELAAVIFCQGCPWRCHYCQNPELLSRQAKTDLSWSLVTDFLYQRRGLLDAVVFSGGEPTLQAGLAAAVAEVRSMGFRIGLHTAGCYPQRLDALLPLVDWIGLDIKALPEDYARLTGVADSGRRAWESLQRVLAFPGLDYEIRVTVDEGLQTPGKLASLIDRLALAGVRYLALQECRQQSATPGSMTWKQGLEGLSDRFDSILFRPGD